MNGASKYSKVNGTLFTLVYAMLSLFAYKSATYNRIACFKDGTFFVFYLSDKNEVILLEINNCSN